MKRSDALTFMRIAGYHDDRKQFTRLLIENRVNRNDADDAFERGRAQRAGGMSCSCFECNK